MLVDVEGGQPKGELVLELGCKPFLGHVVGALHVQILEGHRVRPEQLVRVARDEGDAEQAAKVVRPGPGGDLETNGFTLFLRNYCKLGVKPLSAPGPCSRHPHPLGRRKHKKRNFVYFWRQPNSIISLGDQFSIGYPVLLITGPGGTGGATIIYCFSDTKVRKESCIKQVNGAEQHPAHYINSQKTIAK